MIILVQGSYRILPYSKRTLMSNDIYMDSYDEAHGGDGNLAALEAFLVFGFVPGQSLD